jgi:cytochrome c peroxidase
MKLLQAFLFTLAFAPFATAAENSTPLATLRERAFAIAAPLPEKMPGAEADTAALVELGKKLYFDVRLSANNTQSCNSCHAVDNGRGGVDNEPTSPGAFGKRGGRNSPTVLNAGFQIAQFWDGRAADLAAQAKGPILNPIEMAMPHEAGVLEKLRTSTEYPAEFTKAFGSADALTYDNLARAIAAFERTLVTRDRFDDFLNGDDKALTAEELKGLDTFMTVGCTACHNGPLLGGNSYQKIGLVHAFENLKDLGRYDVTKDEGDRFKFKVPMLRNIAITGPYFHDGATETLEEAVRRMSWHQLGQRLSDEQVKAIVTFLRTLTDKPRAGVLTAAK